MSSRNMSGKRRKKKNRYIGKLIGVLLAALILGAIFVCLFMFRLTTVNVSGNYHETDDEIRALVLSGPLKGNSLFVSAYYNNKKVDNDSFIDTLDVTYVKHDTVSVRVREKELVGYVKYGDSYWYFDRDGRVLVRSLYDESAYKTMASGGKLPSDSAESTASMPTDGANGAEASALSGTESAASMPSEIESGDEQEMSSDIDGGGMLAAAAGKDGGEQDSMPAGKSYHLTGPGRYLTDEDTYVEPETADYDEYAYDEDEYSEDYDEYSEDYDEYSEDYDEYSEEYYEEETEEYDGETEEYSDYEDGEYDDGGQTSDGEDEVILIQPELMDETSVTPIPADESSVSAVTPIPAEEVLVKEYASEDVFEGNYIPKITGLRFTQAAIGEKLPSRYASIYTALGGLKSFADKYGIYPTSVDISETGDLQLHFNDVTVNLGKGEHIERRLAVFRQIMEELLGRSGTLHLENYEGTESRLIFSKNEKNS